jgi:hypothetical protein
LREDSLVPTQMPTDAVRFSCICSMYRYARYKRERVFVDDPSLSGVPRKDYLDLCMR